MDVLPEYPGDLHDGPIEHLIRLCSPHHPTVRSSANVSFLIIATRPRPNRCVDAAAASSLAVLIRSFAVRRL
jgi:hypothetical protein